MKDQISVSRGTLLFILGFISPARMIRLLSQVNEQDAHCLLELWRAED